MPPIFFMVHINIFATHGYMLITVKNMTKINDLKALLKHEIEMKELGVATKIMEMEIQRDANK